ncbi:saccharopine dehydrogenase family protein [Ovoidimarina sediminis]|uniref:saccharopine dehydrogenase family protein n=1 Tax=Ovoidimarina sediminis TaxID=3079856 RepID=UPI00290B2486|nr:saccharopine dehydrogenase NADP-binding domain-containing protein [Rhodophyticola sp. MJ-SS7]MDU8945265.1 saccharopine dehydrogenase NADP-binding domain-containing protein [Rhodophyticola sp. MJ-SS7]
MGYRIALLGGAGMMGRGIARDLLSDLAIVPIDELKICDMTEGGMAALASELSDVRLSTHPTDVTDATALAGSLTGVDICINAVPTLAGHQMRIFEAARAAGVDYCDLGGLGTFTVRQLEHRDRFRESGVTAVLGIGADPGLSNVICRAVADKLDTIDSIHLYWAAELVGPENPILVPPYSVSTVLAEYANPSTQFVDGAHVTCPPLSGQQIIDLPEPWGRCDFMFSPHSEQLTVPLAPGIAEKGIRDFTWRLHLPHREHEAWIGLVKAGFGEFDRPVQINGTDVSPLDLLNAVIARNIAENSDKIPDQESHEIHFAIGTGTIGDAPATVRCEAIVRPDPIYDGYVDAATSMNASIAAQLMLLSDPKPGVWAPESYFDPETYFAEARKRKITISLEVTH